MRNARRHIKVLLIVCTLLSPALLSGQSVLTLGDAIREGLDHDFGVRILRNQEIIAANQNTPGNAGMLPHISANGGFTYQIQNTEQRFISGETSIRDGAQSRRFDAAISAQWTAFDGFRMFARRDRLAVLEDHAREQTKAAMHALVVRIQAAYLQLIRLHELQHVVQQSLVLHRSVRDLAAQKLQLGAGTRLSLLQATNQVNADSVRLIELEAIELQQKIVFNRLTGQDPDRPFSVDTALTIPPIVSIEALRTTIRAQNHELRLLHLDILAAEHEIKEVKSALYPTLDLNAGYGYVFQRSDAGFLLSNRTFGPVAGITLKYDLFTGRSIRKDLQIAEVYRDILALSEASLRADLEALLAERYARYLSYMLLEDLEQRNVALAAENTALAQEMYRYGRATDFEVREAILQEVQSRDRVVEARYQRQLAAISLMQLTGQAMEWVE